MHVTMGSRELVLDGDYLGLMHDATALLDRPEALAERFERDGFLLLRGVLDREVVGAARRLLVDRLRESSQLDPHRPPDDLVAAPRASGALPDARRDRATARLLRTLLDARPLGGALRAVLGDAAVPLEVVPHADGHGRHLAPRLADTRRRECSCWAAVDDVSFPAGPIAVLEGSHRLSPARRGCLEGMMRQGADRPRPVLDPVALVDHCGGRWLTTEFSAGDVLVVRRGLLHGSLSNTTGRFRLTCEARFTAGAPVDGRDGARTSRWNPESVVVDM